MNDKLIIYERVESLTCRDSEISKIVEVSSPYVEEDCSFQYDIWWTVTIINVVLYHIWFGDFMFLKEFHFDDSTVHREYSDTSKTWSSLHVEYLQIFCIILLSYVNFTPKDWKMVCSSVFVFL